MCGAWNRVKRLVNSTNNCCISDYPFQSSSTSCSTNYKRSSKEASASMVMSGKIQVFGGMVS